MKTRHFLLYLLIIFINTSLFAQNVINNGATITIADNTVVTLTNSGDFTNSGNGALVVSGTTGQLVIPGNFINTDGTVDLDGIITLTGNFTNNDALTNVFTNVDADGFIVFAGTGTQTVSSSLSNMSNYIFFENVTINSASDTEVSSGSAITVNGALSVDGSFYLRTPLNDDAAASLITNSTIAGTGDVNLERYFKVGDRWIYISVPIDNQTSTPLIDTPYPGYVNPNFYFYNEPNQGDDPNSSAYNNWDDFPDTYVRIATGSGLGIGQGYIWNAYQSSDVNITFSSLTPSDINTGNTSVNVTYTDNDDGGTPSSYGEYFDGWNLVGNPYPSAINWDAIDRTGSSIDNTVYIFDGDLGNYSYHINGADDLLQGSGQTLNGSVGGFIPAYQSFFVHLTPTDIDDDESTTNETLDLTNSHRVHSDLGMYKNEDKEDKDFNYLILRTEKNGLFDETLVRFIKNTNSGFNGKEDAFKMFPATEGLPLLYSLVTNPELPLAINTLPESEIGTTIPLGFNISAPGSYSISVKDFNFTLDTEVKLIDTYLDTETALEQDVEYSFNFDGGENRDRFYLFVGPTSSSDIDDFEKTADVNIWSSYNKVFVSIGSYDLIDAEIDIVDVLGKTVINKRLNGTYNIVEVPGSSGTYFVKVRTKDGKNHMSKVFIQR